MASKIAHARTLARLIIRHLDALPMEDNEEVRRVMNTSVPLAESIDRGFIAQVTDRGMEELVLLADMLLSESFLECRHLAMLVQPGDELIVTDHADSEPYRVRIDAVNPAGRRASFYATCLTGPRTGKTVFVPIFWSWYHKPVQA